MSSGQKLEAKIWRELEPNIDTGGYEQVNSGRVHQVSESRHLGEMLNEDIGSKFLA